MSWVSLTELRSDVFHFTVSATLVQKSISFAGQKCYISYLDVNLLKCFY